jgi:hypothetical protein
MEREINTNACLSTQSLRKEKETIETNWKLDVRCWVHCVVIGNALCIMEVCISASSSGQTYFLCLLFHRGVVSQFAIK